MSCTQPEELRAAAEEYVRIGYGTLPLEPNGKRPVSGMRRGFRDAAFTTERVAQLFGALPLQLSNVGLVPPSNVLVLDFDVSKDESEPVDTRLQRTKDLVNGFNDRYPELADCPHHETPSGGAHVFIRIPDNNGLATTVNVIEGVDLRGLGRGYLVAPPSVINDKPYKVIRALTGPETLPLASTALIKVLTRPVLSQRARSGLDIDATSTKGLKRYVLTALKGEYDLVASTPNSSGNCNNTLHLAAIRLGSLVGAGLLRETDAIDALLLACETNAMPFTEARATVRSGLNYGIQHPRSLSGRP